MSLSLGMGLGLTMQRGGSWLGSYDFEGNEAVFVDNFVAAQYFNDGVKSFAALNTFTRASDGTYENSSGVVQTAAANEARFPYRSGTAEGGLIEPAATNLRTRSEDFTHGDWNYDGASSSGNTIAGPDGLVTADTITENTANSLHRVIDYAGADNTRHTISRWVKADGRTKFTMFAFDSDADTNYASASFDIDAITSAAEPSGGNGVTHFTDIIEYANGWFRLIFSFTANTSGSGGIMNMQVRLQNSGGAQAYIGDGVSGIHIAAAQLELGDYATSYIKTEASSASRASDALSTTSGGLPYADWDATKVSGKIAVTPLADGALNYVSFNDGTSNEVIQIHQDASNNVRLTVTDGGSVQCDIDSLVNAIVGTELVIAYRAGANDFAISVNGNAEQTDASGTMPTVTTQDIGENCTFKSHVAYAALITDLATLST